jgi:hypothetical protein
MEKAKTNKIWHQDNRMPVNSTLEQRIQWHIKHAKNCKCRPMPDNISKEIKKRYDTHI